MKRKKLPPPPLGLVSLPGLNPEEVRLYESAKFDEIGLRCIDYGSYCLMRPESKEAFERLWLYLDVREILIWLQEQAREAIRKGQQQGRPNNFSGSAYPIGVVETGNWVVISLRLSIYSDGTERKRWRVFLATDEGLEQIQKQLTEDIEATAQKMNDLTEESGGGVN